MLINCAQSIDQPIVLYDQGSVKVELIHQDEDPKSVNRLYIKVQDLEIEFFPSRGFSLGQAWINHRPVFWNPPSPLYDPQQLDLAGSSLHINQQPAPGFMYIKTFMAGIELLGLDNWGMPYQDQSTGVLKVLHGDVHAIPVNDVVLSVVSDKIFLEASFYTRTNAGNYEGKWYENGDKLYKVTRRYEIDRLKPHIGIRDRFKNVTNSPSTPDWGYHVTFQPAVAAEYLVPAKRAFPRGGGSLPADFATWNPAPVPEQRLEQGIIYQDLNYSSQDEFCTSLLKYPDGPGVLVKTPPSPYFQTWFCSGGAGSKEFTWPDGTPVLQNNWDGMGIEFGASALDHDSNTDPTVAPEQHLDPDETREINFTIEWIDDVSQVEELSRQIKAASLLH
ncbi:MAG: DUF4432 family protein [Candidatus Cyclobacteriaceae bacterium M3_2C_046]